MFYRHGFMTRTPSINRGQQLEEQDRQSRRAFIEQTRERIKRRAEVLQDWNTLLRLDHRYVVLATRRFADAPSVQGMRHFLRREQTADLIHLHCLRGNAAKVQAHMPKRRRMAAA